MAEEACHVVTSTTRFGLTQALERTQLEGGFVKHFRAIAPAFMIFLVIACSNNGSHGSPAGVKAISGCPTLPKDANLTWQQSRLEDGITCYAINPDGTVAFGFLVGATPVDRARDEMFVAPGQVAGIPVRWVKSTSASSRQAHVSLSDGLQLHAFVPELPQVTLQQRLGVLAALALRSAP